MSTPIAGFRESSLLSENKKPVSRSRGLPTLGFVVADTTLKPLWANQAAIAILTYSENGGRPQRLAEAFERNLRRKLIPGQGFSTVSPTAIQLESGRRTYFCRVFLLEGAGSVPTSAAVVMVLERGVCEPMALSQVSEQFHLTRREQEAVTLLLRGLSNKEMADRMLISTNTVKALLRMVMVKMRVSSRSTVVARILGLNDARNQLTQN